MGGWSLGVVVPVRTGCQPPTDWIVVVSSCEDGCGHGGVGADVDVLYNV